MDTSATCGFQKACARFLSRRTYHSGDGKANIQCNPIIVDGVMFVPTAGRNIVALNAATGKELWRFDPQSKGNHLEDVPARRGLLFWPGEKSSASFQLAADEPS